MEFLKGCTVPQGFLLEIVEGQTGAVVAAHLAKAADNCWSLRSNLGFRHRWFLGDEADVDAQGRQAPDVEVTTLYVDEQEEEPTQKNTKDHEH